MAAPATFEVRQRPTASAAPRRWAPAVGILLAFVAVLCSGALLLEGSATGNPPRPGPAREARVVRIEVVGGTPAPRQATGTLVDDGVVLTVAHAVVGAEVVQVRSTCGPASTAAGQTASVVTLDGDRDLALLSTQRAIRCAGRPVDRLEWAAAEPGGTYSFVGGASENPGPSSATTWRSARVDRVATVQIADPSDAGNTGAKVRREALGLTAEIDDGDSGTALFDSRGRAVGVVFAASRADDGRAWAVSSVEVRRFLAEAGPG